MLSEVIRAILGPRSLQNALPAAHEEPKQLSMLEARAVAAPPDDGQLTSPVINASVVTSICLPVQPLPPAHNLPSVAHPNPQEKKQFAQEVVDGRVLASATSAANEASPLFINSALHERAAASRTSRSRAAIFEPDHYRRHEGMPGHLYMARNPFHVDGLYKLGYTTLTPHERINWLNAEHSQLPDVGKFHLIHAVQVPAAYDAERALFDLLLADRPVLKREFFFHSESLLIQALDATCAFTTGRADALDDFVLSREHTTALESPPVLSHAVVPSLLTPQGGWIYITHCQWHRSNVYRISYTRNDPRLAVAVLNARQKRLTCRIGFHTLVHCVSVYDLRTLWTKVTAALESWRVEGSRVFYEASIGQLTEAIAQANPASQGKLELLTRRQDLGEVTVELVRGQVAKSWEPWAKSCPGCTAILRFTGAIGAKGKVGCPACGCMLKCTVGASKAEINANL